MNLIFILPDQLGADVLGCYGADVITPRIDAFSEQGVKFTRAYTSSPICTPYRGVLFSGRYPYETGVTGNGMALPLEGFVPLAERFDRAGYATSYVGKWHLGGEPGGNQWVPPEQRGGFRDFIGWESHHVDHWKGLIFEDGPEAIAMEGHETDALTGIACDRIRKLKAGDDPFCLFVAYQAPHPPCTPPERFAALYDGHDGKIRPNVPDDPPDYNKPGWDAMYPQDEFVRRYLGEVSHLDAAIGQILDTIDDEGLADETIVILTSDHGELAGCHGLFSKLVMLEESVHVPLIFRYPGRKPEATDRLFGTVDFYPTLLSLLGGEPGTGHRGADQSMFVRDGGGSSRALVFSEYETRCVLDERYKLITDHPMTRTIALYDRQSDPYEMENRQGDPALATVESRLLAALRNEFSQGE